MAYSNIVRDIKERETLNDYDSTSYLVESEEGSKYVKLSFKCHGYDQIMENGGKEMLEALYKRMS